VDTALCIKIKVRKILTMNCYFQILLNAVTVQRYPAAAAATPASLLPPRQAETAPSKQQLHLAPSNSAMQTGACKQA